MVEFDVVAESFDKKHILIGECKWTNKEDALRLVKSIETKIEYLPFVKKGQSVHIILFLKCEPHNNIISIGYSIGIIKTTSILN